MTTTDRGVGRVVAGAAAAALCAALLLAVVSAQEKVRRRPIVIIGGTIVDGTGAPARRNDAIVIQDGRIRMMGLTASKRAPKDARMIDATSKWIVPGLVDGAVHLAQTGGLDARPDLFPSDRPYAAILSEIQRAPAPYLRAFVCSGVTSVLNIGGPAWTFELRTGRVDDELSPRIATTGPRLAGRAPSVFQLAGQEGYLVPDEQRGVPALVERLAASKPDLVAIALDAIPGEESADASLVRAVVAQSRSRKLRIVAEVSSLAELRAAVEAGVDAVVTRVGDAIPPDLVEAIVRQRVVIIPALSITDAVQRVIDGPLAADEFETRCAPGASVAQVAAQKNADATSKHPLGSSLAGEIENLRRLSAAGASIAAGSGAGEPRAFHGTSLHRAFDLMARAGMTPMQIIDAATRGAAALIGRQADVGQIKEGMDGDLVLLDADPLADIRHLRRVSMTIRGGAIYER